MFEHWESAEATIVGKRNISFQYNITDDRYEFIADVRWSGQPVFRAILQTPTYFSGDFWNPNPGDVVNVLVDPKSMKVKFDKSDPRLSYRAYKQRNNAQFDAIARGVPADAPVTNKDDLAVLNAIRAQWEASPAEADPAARLRKLQELKQQGLVSDAEYEQLRQQILGTI
jgi:hypothetical protein